MVDMFGIPSPVSDLAWALEVLSNPVLTSLSVDYMEKNKRVIFSVQQLQLKQQRKKKLKNLSFLSPTFMCHSWGAPSPQNKPFLILMDRATSPSNTDGNDGKHNHLGTIHSQQLEWGLSAQDSLVWAEWSVSQLTEWEPWTRQDKVSVQYMACLLHPMKGLHGNGHPAQSLSWSFTILACLAASSTNYFQLWQEKNCEQWSFPTPQCGISH